MLYLVRSLLTTSLYGSFGSVSMTYSYSAPPLRLLTTNIDRFWLLRLWLFTHKWKYRRFKSIDWSGAPENFSSLSHDSTAVDFLDNESRDESSMSGWWVAYSVWLLCFCGLELLTSWLERLVVGKSTSIRWLRQVWRGDQKLRLSLGSESWISCWMGYEAK